MRKNLYFNEEFSIYSLSSLEEFINKLIEIKNKIPEGIKEDISSYDGYIEVSWSKPETMEEWQERVVKEKNATKEITSRVEAEERNTLRVLLRKYGIPNEFQSQ